MIVYMLLNLIEERAYVGQTVNTVNQRVKGHWDDTKKGDDSILHTAMRKWDDPSLWTYVVLQNCYSQQELDVAEAWWIRELCTVEPGVGYNSKQGSSVVKRSPRDARSALTTAELDFYRACGHAGAEKQRELNGGKHRKKSDMTEEEREKFREWGRKGALKSKELAKLVAE